MLKSFHAVFPPFYPALLSPFIILFLPLYREFEQLLASKRPLSLYHISCKSALFPPNPIGRVRLINHLHRKNWEFLRCNFLSFFFLRNFKREWPPGKTVDILVQKKEDKTASAPSGDGIFQGPPSGLKNVAILFDRSTKKNQKRTLKKSHQKIARYPFMQF